MTKWHPRPVITSERLKILTDAVRDIVYELDSNGHRPLAYFPRVWGDPMAELRARLLSGERFTVESMEWFLAGYSHPRAFDPEWCRGLADKLNAAANQLKGAESD